MGTAEPAAGDQPAADTATTATDTNAAGGEPVGAGVGRPIHPVTPGKPLIQIVVPYSTLIGADDQPAELVGHGPVPASLAREVAVEGVWRRLVTDPLSGTLLDYGRATYHPPVGLADHVRARDVYCRAPGCRRRAADAELDHVVAWSDGGTTCENNLRSYCTGHHRLKTHAPGWRVRAHPDGGLTWITPTGHRAHDPALRLPTRTATATAVTADFRTGDTGPPAPPAPPAPTEPDPDPPPF